MANPAPSKSAPEFQDQPAAPAAAPTPPASAGPVTTAADVAALQEMLAEQQATIAKLKAAVAAGNAATGDMSAAELAAMTGVGAGSSNARDESAPVPRHFTHGTPIFNPNRPTGRAG